MLSLFPEIKPYARHRLAVDEPHELYIDESGEQDGLPLLFLHGGPGSGCAFDSRRFFDPGRYRILLLDQRGSGRSTPAGELNANTTAHLVQDMEQIREFLGVKCWVLGAVWCRLGRSPGSGLYAGIPRNCFRPDPVQYLPRPTTGHRLVHQRRDTEGISGRLCRSVAGSTCRRRERSASSCPGSYAGG